MSPPRSPSGEDRAGRALLILIGALAVLRLLAAAAVPLTEDEAYYRLWAQHLRLGYYDHPPMVAWWIAAGVRIAGDTALGVRLLPALSSLGVTALVFDLGRCMGSSKTGLTAALLYNATLTVGVGAFLALPDVPASLFWILALWCVVRAVGDGRMWASVLVVRTADGHVRPSPAPPNDRWWIATGAAAGLACLSKYSALFLAPGLLLWLVLCPPVRGKLRTPWPWLAAAVALAIFSANIAWNAEHHWLTFAKQFGRVAPGRFAPRYMDEFITAQFALLNPAVAILAGAGAVRAWRARGDAVIPLMAAITSAPFLAYLLLHSLHDRVQAHWPVPLYPAAALLAAYAAERVTGWRAGLARWGAPLGIGLTTLALIYMAAPQAPAAKGDPAAPLRGWPSFAERVEALRASSRAAWVGSLSYGVNGQLQAQHRLEAPVLQINERDRYADLPSAAPDLTRPGLIVDLQRRLDPAKLTACFGQVGPVLKLNRGSGLDADSRYAAVVVAAPKADLLKDGCGA